MKRFLITLALAFSLLAVPSAKAFDRDEDLQADVHSLWEWHGHLSDESRNRGDRHTRDELEASKASLQRVEGELHTGHHGDRVRGEIDGIRDDLRHISQELNWHGEIHHRQGFIIELH